jgi:hypothetical protein
MSIVSKPRSKRPHPKHKRIHINNLSKGIPLEVLDEWIEEMAENEEYMSRYEKGQEIG